MGDRPQSVWLPALWEAKKQVAPHSALTAYREHLLQRPGIRSCFPDLISLEQNCCSAVSYIALGLQGTNASLLPQGETGPKASGFQLAGKISNNLLSTVLLQPKGNFFCKAL